MALLEVVKLGNPILTTKAIKVTDPGSDRLRNIAADMIETMLFKEGIGIAAPQIGVSERLIIVNAKDGPYSLINPSIVSHSFRKVTEEEGCLSIPGVFGLVTRFKKVRVTALDLDGHKQLVDGEGLLARVLQHEIDHIDGKLFVDKAKKLTRGEHLLTTK
jgi:peptide deformylase